MAHGGPRGRAHALEPGGFSAFALGLATHLFSPYELNPLDINPLRELLNELVDFAALRARSPMPILIAATQVRTGQCRIFREHELTADMVLASACLPQLHHAIEIEGEAYWDGGFVQQPAGRGAGRARPQPDPCSSCGSTRRGDELPRSAPPSATARPRSCSASRWPTSWPSWRRSAAWRDGPLGLLQPRLRRLARLDVQIIEKKKKKGRGGGEEGAATPIG